MSIRNLDYLFRPNSIAVIGASQKAYSVGATVMRNLLAAGFHGPIMPVNPKYKSIGGVLSYPDVASLPVVPDLAVICTPPSAVPQLIAKLGEHGTRAAVVLTAGLDLSTDDHGRTFQQAALEEARPYLLRILGPNCVGIIIPELGLNASFGHTSPSEGKIAFVTQSGALATAVLDWAKSQGIGFSHFVSLGNCADVDFGDVLDYLANDLSTRAILLYIESIKDSRKFMSAARAASRNKTVLAIKAGRVSEGAKAAFSHTGAMAGSDDVFDAALRRAGILRVDTIEHLFNSVETLARARPLKGDKLLILTNGGGPGVMATDHLIQCGGQLASLSDDTMEKMDKILPSNWSHGNPVDIIGDAPVERYVSAFKILLEDSETNSILFIHAPTAIVPSEKIAQGLLPMLKDARQNILSCWLGLAGVARARQIFMEAGLPTYDSPEDAVNGFLQMVNFRHNQEMLMETPDSIPTEFQAGMERACPIIQKVLASGHTSLTEPEAKEVLSAYGIPTVLTCVAATAEDAVRLAVEIGFPVAVKILSPDITHKSDVGGVALDLETAEQVHDVASGMIKRLKELYPDARINGFSVQKMARRPGAYELIVGSSTDSVFGPVILFGQGGTAVEVIRDRAVALPPLNMTLARELVGRTRISRLLAGYRNRPAADMNAIYRTLMQLSQIMADIPEIIEIDINPLFADAKGVLALDARIRVAPAELPGDRRLAIRPYPGGYEERISFQGRQVLLRPIRPEDEPEHRELYRRLEPEDIRFRLFGLMREPSHSVIARLTQIDYDREMAFIATSDNEEGRPETLGVARVVKDPDNIRGEFAVIVRSDMKGRGLGKILMQKLIRYCRSQGTRELVGQVLRDNTRMLNLSKKLGFEIQTMGNGDILEVKLDLKKAG